MKKLFNAFLYCKNLVVITLLSQKYSSDIFVMQSLGNKGADWFIPSELIKSDWIVYSGGVGEDISFDTELIREFGCQVFAFDPTPRAIQFVKKSNLSNFNFYPLGIWKKDSLLIFFSPSNPEHVSHSAVNLQKTTSSFKAPCLTIKSIMKKLGHSRIDLLKLDIEGAEFAVLHNMLEDQIFPKVVTVEFDQPCTVTEMMDCIQKLHRAKYSLVKQDFFNFSFVKN